MDITFKPWTRKEEGNVKGLVMCSKQATCNAAQERTQNSNTLLESSNEGFRSQGRMTSGNVFRIGQLTESER